MEKQRYNHFNKWLKNKFGERTLKICIDGDFTCPNRDGTCGTGGCIFCGERGSGENIKQLDIKTQVINHLNSYKGQRANKFIAYFQNFTNTYGSLNNLKAKYNSALVDDKIVALAVATRPDCVNEDVAKLLASYAKQYYVYVELGLQTASDTIGKFINRGYTTQNFINAVNILKKHNIDVVAHVMVGLPNETLQDIKDTIALINRLKIMGIKIHSTYVIQNTKLEQLYLNGQYQAITLEYYVDVIAQIISWLSQEIVVCRITGDAPKTQLVAPEWNSHKKIVLNSINRELNNKNIFQGCNELK